MGEVASKQFWFVAMTRSCQEKKSVEALAGLGIECYLPLQKVRRKWSDRVKILEQPVMPRIVFVRCSPDRRRALASQVYGVTGFLMDRSLPATSPLVVPEKQLEQFRKFIDGMNGMAEVSITTSPIRKGSKVRILNGPLQGFICECVELSGKRHVVVRLGMLGTAVAQVDIKDIEPAD